MIHSLSRRRCRALPHSRMHALQLTGYDILFPCYGRHTYVLLRQSILSNYIVLATLARQGFLRNIFLPRNFDEDHTSTTRKPGLLHAAPKEVKANSKSHKMSKSRSRKTRSLNTWSQSGIMRARAFLHSRFSVPGDEKTRRGIEGVKIYTSGAAKDHSTRGGGSTSRRSPHNFI